MISNPPPSSLAPDRVAMHLRMRSSPMNASKHLILKTVTFGIVSVPFSAGCATPLDTNIVVGFAVR